MAKILVTGATGTVGSAVVKALRERDVDVRAGVHSPDKAADLRSAGAEVVECSFDKPGTLEAAFAGVDRVFLLTPFVNTMVAQVKAGVAAARQAGVKFLVRMSGAGADVSAPLNAGRWHGEADKLVAESGIPYALIQPTFFMDNLTKFHVPSVRGQGAFYGASGTGKTAYISSADIAAVAAAILLDPDQHVSRTYVLTGPEALSDEEVAALISKVAGREVKYVNLTADALAAGARQSGAPDWMVEALVGFEGVKANGWAAQVSPAVAEILGKPGETYQSFLARHEDVFVAG